MPRVINGVAIPAVVAPSMLLGMPTLVADAQSGTAVVLLVPPPTVDGLAPIATR